MKVSAILAAAGRGERFGAAQNKILLPLAGRSVMEWSLAAFASIEEIVEILVVGSERDFPRLKSILQGFDRNARLIAGGAERFDSVWAALQAVSPNSDVVLIHDAARPLVRGEWIREAIREAAECGGAIVAVPATDTAKRSVDGKRVLKTVPRESLWRAQTPQAFRREPFLDAYRRAVAEGFRSTDDAGVAERFGIPVAIVRGDESNLKITSPEDLDLAEFYLSKKRS